MSLGDNIKRLRRDKAWTQGDLSDKTGIKLGHISKLERDESDPKLETIYKLMNAFNCSADALLMDPEKTPLDGVVRAAFERAANLPEANKRSIIDVIDNYCIAIGFKAQFTSPEGNKFLWFKGAPKDMLPNEN